LKIKEGDNMRTIRTLTVTVLILALSFFASELVAKSFLQPVVSISGKVIEDTNEVGLGLNIYILNDSGKTIGISKSNEVDGNFFVTGLKPGTTYTFVFKSDKQTIKKMLVATPLTDKYLELEQDFFLKIQNNKLQTLNK
jgi:hypothetical protein